ncbi:transposase [Chloroflexus sp.]|uniref:transposase n=1 Tax=Chloroflexus sp. TaxID=1904827 RepID=UPI002ADE2B54|nr:transposase [Chloroflexus sp.]
MSSHDLTDDQWAVIEPRIPKQQRTRGRPRTDDRRTRNGMVAVLPTGCAWADLPTENESPSTCWRRWPAWSHDGTWERSWRTRLRRRDTDGTLAWARAVLDGSVVPAKQGVLAEAQRRSATAPR